MAQDNSNNQKATFISNLPEKIMDNSTLHLNLSEGFIFITEDKVRICLMKYVEYLQKRGIWLTPLSIMLTIATVLLTADFNDRIFNKEVWNAIFVIAEIMSIIWLIISLFKIKKQKSVDDVINDLKIKAGHSPLSSSNTDTPEEKNIEAADTQKFLLNYIYDKKGAKIQDILNDLAMDYYSLKTGLRLLLNRRLIEKYWSVDGQEVYCLSDTEGESKIKYPEKEIDFNLPF